MAMILANDEADYSIKPEAATPALNTSDWPLLLKGYDKRNFALNASISLLRSLTLSSPRPYGTFHSNSVWLHSIEARPEILY